ncbi:MAG: hypothetical protein WBM53_10565 [Maribacter sp.]
MKRRKNIQILFLLPFVLIIFLWPLTWTHAQELAGDEVCSFTIGDGSSFSGTYVVEVDEGGAVAYNDFENSQFVIEINGNNNISIMLILESLTEGKHVFSMEMQVAMDISKDGGDSYVGFSNYKEEGGGYIQIDKIDKDNAKLLGGFSGTFHEDTAPEGVNVELSGAFNVILE